MSGKIWFVGAGPGDPDLITVKGRDLLEGAGAVLYAGSLVDQTAMRYTPAGCDIRDSRDMTLEEMTSWLKEAAARHRTVVRLQTGDPGFVMPPTLFLTISHPTRAGLDQSRVLQRNGDTYSGEVRLPAAGHWLVLVEDESRTWRVMGNVILPANGETIIGSPGPVPAPSDIRN